MPNFEITSPSGQKFIVSGPEGSTQEQALAHFQANYKPSAADIIAADEITQGAKKAAGYTPAELIAGSAPGRFAAGAAAPFMGLAQFAAHLAGGGQGIDELIKQNEELKQRGRQAYESTGADIAGAAGTVLSPGVLKGAQAVGAATKLLPRALGSAALGATVGATEPVTHGDFTEEKAKQAATGAVVGGVLPPAAALTRGLLKAGYQAVEPVLSHGPENIFTRYVGKLAGSAKDKIVQALEQARSIVPGSEPTAGEAVASMPEATRLAAHQRAVATSEPAAPGFVQREAEQEAARQAHLATIAKTPAALASAEGARAADAMVNYDTAFKTAAKADPELEKLAEDPYFKRAMPAASDLSESKGAKIPSFGSGEAPRSAILGPNGEPLASAAPASGAPQGDLIRYLHYVKVGLDKQLSAKGDAALASTEKEAVQGVKKRLIDWMDKATMNLAGSAYGKAREAFAAASQPINDMQVGQLLQRKLESPLGNIERAGAFANAAREGVESVKRATGFEADLSPQAKTVVDALVGDLQRKAAFDRLARGTHLSGSLTPENPLPNLLSRPAMAINWAAKKLGHNLEDKVNAIAGEAYLNPSRLAETLKGEPPSAVKKVMDELMKNYRYAPATVLPTLAASSQGR